MQDTTFDHEKARAFRARWLRDLQRARHSRVRRLRMAVNGALLIVPALILSLYIVLN